MDGDAALRRYLRVAMRYNRPVLLECPWHHKATGESEPTLVIAPSGAYACSHCGQVGQLDGYEIESAERVLTHPPA